MKKKRKGERINQKERCMKKKQTYYSGRPPKNVLKYPAWLDTTFLCPVWEAPKTIQTIAILPHYSTELADKTLLKIPYTSVSSWNWSGNLEASSLLISCGSASRHCAEHQRNSTRDLAQWWAAYELWIPTCQVRCPHCAKMSQLLWGNQLLWLKPVPHTANLAWSSCREGLRP